VFGRQQQLNEMLSGMTQVSYISELAKDPEAVLDRLLADFAAIEQHLRVAVGNVRAQVNAAGAEVNEVESAMTRWWKDPVLDSSRFVFLNSPLQAPKEVRQQLFFSVPSQVNFVARALNTGLSYSHPASASVALGAKVSVVFAFRRKDC
jgi:Zn-dependent M16 (insulinase) family peptidase